MCILFRGDNRQRQKPMQSSLLYRGQNRAVHTPKKETRIPCSRYLLYCSMIFSKNQYVLSKIVQIYKYNQLFLAILHNVFSQDSICRGPRDFLRKYSGGKTTTFALRIKKKNT